jgi:mRNA interferase RelE/StbE
MWIDKYLREAKADLDRLDPELREIILAGIKKVRQNPLPQNEGGYGKALGNKGGNNLTGFFKIKYKGKGIRVIYTLAKEEKIMNIIAISKRDEKYCYNLAARRKKKYGESLFKDFLE